MAFDLMNLEPEPPRVFTRADGTVWLRTGHCSLCGDCCRGQFETGDCDPDINGGLCSRATWLNDGVGGKIFNCLDHGKAGTYWSMGCNEWPTKPEHLLDAPRCTYRFTRVR